jgi:hypothetical protein
MKKLRQAISDSTFLEILRAGATAAAIWKIVVTVIVALGLGGASYKVGSRVAEKQAEAQAAEVAREVEKERQVLIEQISGLNDLLAACRSQLTHTDDAMKKVIAETEKARAAYVQSEAGSADRAALCRQLATLGFACRGAKR